MAVVVLLVNESRPRAVELAGQAATWLVERGHGVRLPKRDAEAAGLPQFGADDDLLVTGVDLAIALGGDGTMLRAVDLVAGHDTPVLGVNLGRLGYLTDVEVPALPTALERFLAGDYVVEDRTMLTLAVSCNQGPPRGDHLALNEAVVEKTEPGHTVHLRVNIDGQPFISYVADGLIIATPTGSTAYSFSAGGPIVSPRQEALLLTPVAPHTPFSRSLVLHRDEPVRIEVLDHRGATLSVDGRELGRLGQGDSLSVRVAPVPAHFIRFEPRDFYGVLKAKFGLTDR
ncbi:MAG: NAD(+)/NADH kinase [Actinomycetota bacterium]|nr:NAD(+)/NADH kinase [Actinomycetota bacterium]